MFTSRIKPDNIEQCYAFCVRIRKPYGNNYNIRRMFHAENPLS